MKYVVYEKNLTKAFALSIPVLVFNLINRPFEHLLNDVITEPSTELAMFIVISSSVFTVGITVISVLVCIKIWNRQKNKQRYIRR